MEELFVEEGSRRPVTYLDRQKAQLAGMTILVPEVVWIGCCTTPLQFAYNPRRNTRLGEQSARFLPVPRG